MGVQTSVENGTTEEQVDLRTGELRFDIGLLAERWYFFADAKHPQNLYYQAIS